MDYLQESSTAVELMSRAYSVSATLLVSLAIYSAMICVINLHTPAENTFKVEMMD